MPSPGPVVGWWSPPSSVLACAGADGQIDRQTQSPARTPPGVRSLRPPASTTAGPGCAARASTRNQPKQKVGEHRIDHDLQRRSARTRRFESLSVRRLWCSAPSSSRDQIHRPLRGVPTPSAAFARRITIEAAWGRDLRQRLPLARLSSSSQVTLHRVGPPAWRCHWPPSNVHRYSCVHHGTSISSM